MNHPMTTERLDQEASAGLCRLDNLRYIFGGECGTNGKGRNKQKKERVMVHAATSVFSVLFRLFRTLSFPPLIRRSN
jgi:hypothetical protein